MRLQAGTQGGWDRYAISAVFSGQKDKGNQESVQASKQESKMERKDRLKNAPEGILTPEEKKELDQLKGKDPKKLDEDQLAMIRKLEHIEYSVRSHEMAHQASGGAMVGVASYHYTKGPDHKMYITGGEVKMKLPAAGSPETMLRAFEQLRRAAGAPGDPSGQDKAMAAFATQKIQQIKTQIAEGRAKDAYQKQLKLKDKLLN